MSEPPGADLFEGGGTMGELMRAVDWAATPFGPVDRWPHSLRIALRICLTSRYPMVIWWGPELRLLYNDAWRPALGALKHPRALGRPGREILPEIWHIIGPMLEGVLATGKATWEDDQLLVYDRFGYFEETYWTYSYSPIPDGAGRVGGVFTAVTETTERVLGERRLRTLRDLSEKAAEARTAVGACTAAADILARNRLDLPFAAIYLVDAGRAKLTAAAGISAEHPAAPAEIALATGDAPWPVGEVVATGQPQVVELREDRHGHIDGGPWDAAPRQALVIPLAASGREAVAGVLVAGVSPRRALDDAYRGFLTLVAGHIATAIANGQAYEEERRRAEALAELDRAKTAFFSNVSHEFRTPLTLQLGPLDDALRDPDHPLPEPQRERIAVAYRNSLRLLKLVNTLLDFSRIEAGRVDAAYEPIDLAQVTADLASTFRSAVEGAGLRLLLDCPPLPAPVYVDHDMWEKIVLNLLSNAFKFTLEGEIEVRLAAEPGRVRLSVRDTGTGIPPQDRDRVFERFYRVRNTISRTHEGSGIGLALVRELVRLHGGEIEVASEVGRGSTFTVTIPTGTAHLPAEQIGTPRRLTSTSLGAMPYVEEALRWSPTATTTPATGPKTPPDPRPRPRPRWLGPGPRYDISSARILVADDNADMREYIARLLGDEWTVTTVADGRQALEAARRERPDLIISDAMMPDLDGFELLRALRADPEMSTTPIILLSARAGEEARVEGLEAGADDYLIKPFSARELHARVAGVLTLARVRRDGEAAIRRSEEALSEFFENAAMALHWVGPDGTILRANRAELELMGYPREEYVGHNIAEFHVDPPVIGDIMRRLAAGETLRNYPARVRCKDGSIKHTLIDSSVYFEDGQFVHTRCFTRDVTRERRAAERLRQAERMEAVGRLAGGVAHEANNQMTVVLGAAAFLLRRPDLPPAAHADVEHIRRAADRTAAITRQLLAFSQRQVLQPQTVQLNEVIRGVETLMRRALGESSRLLLRLSSDLARVQADPGQLEQVLFNFTFNARDAMPDGGTLTIETADVVLDEAYVAAKGLDSMQPGPYVMLVVSDTGCGMDQVTLGRVFEPFFTTKAVGEGTGLGLAVVYGIVKQSGGYIWAYSEPGLGATFKIYLPAVSTSAPRAPSPPDPLPGGTETLLLVEDDAEVRQIMARTLRDQGYTVLEASNGQEALALAARDGDALNLVITDLVMPEMGGREMAARLAERRPDLAVLFTSGYTGLGILEQGLLEEGREFLQKPLTPDALSRKVRELLDRRRGTRAAR